MQLYEGLPIITNKISPKEQRGVRHHLLGHIGLNEPPWAVDDFRREANKVLQEIRSRGNLPILVGGTQYYVDPLLFAEVILNETETKGSQKFAILDAPTEAILEELKRVDPNMANKWHPNDRRKIRRSLEIYLSTGRIASEHYEEQKRHKNALIQGLESKQPWENLLFWVCSDKNALTKRLDYRVDKMLDAGLMDEVLELYRLKQRRSSEGSVPDMTKGIWQSIGYKQFEPYLEAVTTGCDAAGLEKLKAQAIEDMKSATRRYANYQNRWTRLKQIPRLREASPKALRNLFILDSTNVSEYQRDVVEPAAQIAAQFLKGQSLPDPIQVSEFARGLLTKAAETSTGDTPCRKECELCGTVVLTEENWTRHIGSAGHRRAWKKKKKMSLVPAARLGRDGSSSESETSSVNVDVSSIFS